MKSIVAKIALRNILLNKKRSLLIGVAIFLASFLLLFSNAIMNGVIIQVAKGLINIQSGNVAVVWENLKKISNTDATRLLFVANDSSFDVDKDAQNKEALTRLNSFLTDHKSEIEAFYPTVKRGAQLQTSNGTDAAFFINSLSPSNQEDFFATKTFTMVEGKLLSGDYTIAISKQKAIDNNLEIGDMITVLALTPYGAQNSLEFMVGGIFANRSGSDNNLGFVSEQNARELFDYDPGYFDIGRIYLKDPNQAEKFAGELDRYLLSQSPVLRAESSAQASAFYTNTSQSQKMLFSIFIIFLLCIIALGFRSMIRMNLFERMKEFGTLRAIGYNRAQSFLIIFYEVFFLSVIALTCATVVAELFALIFGKVGIYVGSGPMSYAFGGESLYPILTFGDVIFALIAITLLSLISTLNPGLKLCYQKITNLMLKRQQKIYPFMIILKDLLRASKKTEMEPVKSQNIR